MHVSTKQRAERDFRPVPLDGQGYLLAPCVVLAAAIIGTRQAYWAAMAVMGCKTRTPQVCELKNLAEFWFFCRKKFILTYEVCKNF